MLLQAIYADCLPFCKRILLHSNPASDDGREVNAPLLLASATGAFSGSLLSEILSAQFTSINSPSQYARVCLDVWSVLKICIAKYLYCEYGSTDVLYHTLSATRKWIA